MGESTYRCTTSDTVVKQLLNRAIFQLLFSKIGVVKIGVVDSPAFHGYLLVNQQYIADSKTYKKLLKMARYS